MRKFHVGHDGETARRALAALRLIALVACLLLASCATIARAIGGGPQESYAAPVPPKQSPPSRDFCAYFAPFEGAVIRYDPAGRCWWAPKPGAPKPPPSNGMHLNATGTAILYPASSVLDGEAAWLDRDDYLDVACSDTVSYLPVGLVRELVAGRKHDGI